MAKRRGPSILRGGRQRYVMTQTHRDNISKGLQEYHRGRGGKYKIVKRVGKRYRTGVNDNQLGGHRMLTLKPRDRHVAHVMKHFANRALAKRELKDYKRIRNKAKRGRVTRRELYDYRKRARRRFLANRVITKVKSLFKRR